MLLDVIPVNLLKLLVNHGVHLLTGSCSVRARQRRVTCTDTAVDLETRLVSSLRVFTLQLNQFWCIGSQSCWICIPQQSQRSVHHPLQEDKK